MNTIEELCSVDVVPLTNWLRTIPVEDWHKMADAAWGCWGDKFQPLAVSITALYYPGCSVSGIGIFVLEPGQEHPAHKDVQPDNWITRIHVPIVTNNHCTATTEDGVIFMAVGKAYRFNTQKTHAVANKGLTYRAHFVFDVVK